MYYQGKVLLRRGILAPKSEVVPGTILKRVLATQKPIYLVALYVYPGKIEFDYFTYVPREAKKWFCVDCGVLSGRYVKRCISCRKNTIKNLINNIIINKIKIIFPKFINFKLFNGN